MENIIDAEYKFSVLMSVYYKENPNYFKEALDSILVNQSVIPNEVVLVQDGPLTQELDAVIDEFKEVFPDRIKIISLEKNGGLGKALNIGLTHCKYEIVARMDSDDISDKCRFEKQIKFLEDNKEVDIVGGSIAEFYDTYEKIITERKVPRDMDSIIRMMKRRNPINHVSVMFKKSKVIRVGGYKHLPYLEDYYLWIRMVQDNAKIVNIEDVLVYVRTGENMYKRRGNKEYISGWYTLQKSMKKIGIINKFDIVVNMINIIGFIYTPAGVKEFAYKKFLRK
jgi:glycosyltransferase involved in cell wall biosynthesis